MLTGRSGAFKGRSEALRGRSEDVQATLRGRTWVVGSRPDGDAMTGRAGIAGDFPNRLFFIVYFSQKIIIFGYLLKERQASYGF